MEIGKTLRSGDANRGGQAVSLRYLNRTTRKRRGVRWRAPFGRNTAVRAVTRSTWQACLTGKRLMWQPRITKKQSNCLGTPLRQFNGICITERTPLTYPPFIPAAPITPTSSFVKTSPLWAACLSLPASRAVTTVGRSYLSCRLRFVTLKCTRTPAAFM